MFKFLKALKLTTALQRFSIDLDLKVEILEILFKQFHFLVRFTFSDNFLKNSAYFYALFVSQTFSKLFILDYTFQELFI